MSFAGRRVLSLESRRAKETSELIRRNGGEPFVAPSMREVPLESNEPAFSFAEKLLAGSFDTVIFTTGVGTKYLIKILSTRYPVENILDALRLVTVAARGPKPVAALREFGIPVHVNAPEPNTWRELLAALDNRPERRIAVQEYGRTNEDLIKGLEAKGAEVTPVPVYQWQMPEDLQPLREAVQRLADQSVDVALFTTSQQVVHLMDIAGEMGLANQVREGIGRSVVASIGPTTTETLREFGFSPDLEPTHPKLGFLVKEAAENCEEILWKKRS